jgi:hypothetical protein
MMNWERLACFKFSSRHFPEGQRDTTKSISQNSPSPSLESEVVSAEFETGGLTN